MKNIKEEEIGVKGTVNKKLFEVLNDANLMCIKDLYFDKDNDIYEKYARICQERNDNCGECWTQFIVEDLVRVEIKKI